MARVKRKAHERRFGKFVKVKMPKLISPSPDDDDKKGRKAVRKAEVFATEQDKKAGIDATASDPSPENSHDASEGMQSGHKLPHRPHKLSRQPSDGSSGLSDPPDSDKDTEQEREDDIHGEGEETEDDVALGKRQRRPRSPLRSLWRRPSRFSPNTLYHGPRVGVHPPGHDPSAPLSPAPKPPPYISVFNPAASQYPESALRSTLQRKTADGTPWADAPLPEHEPDGNDLMMDEYYSSAYYTKRIHGEWVETDTLKPWAKPDDEYDPKESPFPKEDDRIRRVFRRQEAEEDRSEWTVPDGRELEGAQAGMVAADFDRMEELQNAVLMRRYHEFLVPGRDFSMDEVPLFPPLPEPETREP